jgi:hypothetical protein
MFLPILMFSIAILRFLNTILEISLFDLFQTEPIHWNNLNLYGKDLKFYVPIRKILTHEPKILDHRA